MLNCPYVSEYDEKTRDYESRIDPSFVRVLHACVDAPPVDIYLDNKLIIRNLKYGEFSKYLPMQFGNYNLKIYPSGTKDKLVFKTIFFVPEKAIITEAVIGKISNIGLLTVNDIPKEPLEPSKFQLKFVHISPDAPSIDVTLPDGTIIFKDVIYKEIENYKTLMPNNYTLQARLTGTNKVVLNVPNLIFKPNKIYTVYASGLVANNPPLQLFQALDGSSYIKIRNI